MPKGPKLFKYDVHTEHKLFVLRDTGHGSKSELLWWMVAVDWYSSPLMDGIISAKAKGYR